MSDRGEEYVMGIDEAGRGPVLGPMLYGACLCKVSHLADLKATGVNDSKQLTDEKRRIFFKQIKNSDYLEWIVDTIPADWMSSQMLAKNRYSLNEISHESAMQMISYALHAGFNLTAVYLDTVGIPEAYEQKLNSHFMGYNIKFTVAPKADALYPVVSAASICAKVTRDNVIDRWLFQEKERDSAASASATAKAKAQTKTKENANPNTSGDNPQEDTELCETENTSKTDAETAATAAVSGPADMMKVLGNGYPGDSTTQKWLQNNIDPVFGFPRIVRFSWSTATTILDKKCAPVEWADALADNCLNKWFTASKPKHTKRSNYFQTMNLKLCEEFPF